MRKHDNVLGGKRGSRCAGSGIFVLLKNSPTFVSLPFGSRHRTCEAIGASDDLRHFPVPCAMVLSPKALPLLLPGLRPGFWPRSQREVTVHQATGGDSGQKATY